jgi:uncharacterized protein
LKPIIDSDIYLTVKQYADAWVSGNLKAIVDSYHDQVVFHYFGRNSLAGTHVGKTACLALLKTVKEKTNRKLINIRDILAGQHFGAIIAVEHFERGGDSVEFERLIQFSVRDGKLAECWIYDRDQRLVDEFFS